MAVYQVLQTGQRRPLRLCIAVIAVRAGQFGGAIQVKWSCRFAPVWG